MQKRTVYPNHEIAYVPPVDAEDISDFRDVPPSSDFEETISTGENLTKYSQHAPE